MKQLRDWLVRARKPRFPQRWYFSGLIAPAAMLSWWIGIDPMMPVAEVGRAFAGQGQSTAMPQAPDQPDQKLVSVRLPDAQSQAALRVRLRTRVVAEVPSRASGAEQLAGVIGLVRTDDGGFLVAESSTSRLQLFSSNGVPGRTIGRGGAGPGEFKSMLAMVRCGPRAVAVQDPALNRASIFTFVPRHAGETTLPVGFTTDRIVGCGDSLKLVILSDQPKVIPVEKGVVRTRAVIAIASRAGRVDTIVAMPGTDFIFARQVPGFVDLPLGQRALAAVGSEVIAAGASTDGIVSLFDLTGRPMRRLHFQTPRHRLGAAEVQEAYRERVSLEFGKETQALLTAVLREAPAEAQLPMIADLRVALDDRIWVQTHPPAKSATASWYVVSATGQLEGVLLLARSFTPYEIGSSYILGVNHDADGVETVQLLSIGRDLPPRHEIRE